MGDEILNPCKTCRKIPQIKLYRPIPYEPLHRLLFCCGTKLGFAHKRNPIYKNGEPIYETYDSPEYAEVCLVAEVYLVSEWNRLNPNNKKPSMCDWPDLDFSPVIRG